MGIFAMQVCVALSGGCDEDAADRPPSSKRAEDAEARAVERVKVPASQPAAERTVRVQVEHLPVQLNPLVTRDLWCRWITLGTIFEPLVTTTRTGTFRPFLAASIEPKLKGRRFVLRLRPGVTFHDGHPLTSEDVKYTLETLARRKPATLDLLAAALADVDRVEAPDPATVVLTLRRIDRLFPAVLAEIGILPAHLYRQHGLRSTELNRAPVGTGPFRFERRYGQTALVLARNPSYWGHAAGIARLRFNVIQEPKKALAALRNNEIDILTRLSPAYFPDQVSSRRMRRRFQLVKSRPYRLRVVVFNVRHGPLKDRRVRLALAHLIDRDKMVSRLHNGLAQVLTAPLWVASSGYDGRLTTRSHDPPRAAQLLDAAGWHAPRPGATRRRKGYRLALRVLYSTDSPEAAEVARQLKASLGEAGIRPVIKGGDFGYVMTRLARGGFHLAVMGLAPIVGTSLEPFIHSNGRLNVGRYDNPSVDRLLTHLRVAGDAERRVSLLRQLHRALYEDPPLLVLYGASDVMVARQEIRGLHGAGRWPSLERIRLDHTRSTSGGEGRD